MPGPRGDDVGRVLHLGLGAFARAHTLDATARAADGGRAGGGAAGWGVAGFTGTSPRVARVLSGQGCRYHLVVRGPEHDEITPVTVLQSVHAADRADAWCRLAADPATAVLTLTVTEKAYLLGRDGRPRLDHRDIRADLAALHRDPAAPVRTVPARLAQAVLARERAGTDAGLTVLSCDNLPGNGDVVRRWLDPLLAELGADPSRVGVAATMVDRITPASTAADLELVRRRTGVEDRSAVVTEPFSEWVVQDAFAGPRPAWERAGVRLVEDVTAWEQRKLLLLNGAHLVLAHRGTLAGHRTTAGAWADPGVAAHVEQWWREAAALLPAEVADPAAYLTALRDRFANRRIEHPTRQVATDGSLKMRIRVVPVLRHHLARGTLPVAAADSVAVWARCWREDRVDWPDPEAETLCRAVRGPADRAAASVLALLHPDLADATELVTAVARRLDPAP